MSGRSEGSDDVLEAATPGAVDTVDVSLASGQRRVSCGQGGCDTFENAVPGLEGLRSHGEQRSRVGHPWARRSSSCCDDLPAISAISAISAGQSQSRRASPGQKGIRFTWLVRLWRRYGLPSADRPVPEPSSVVGWVCRTGPGASAE